MTDDAAVPHDEVTPFSVPTTNYAWAKPVVGGDQDVWGGYLNANLDSQDTLINGIQTSIPNENRIINGDMRIDQRNNGASSGVGQNVYCIDRWLYAGLAASNKFTFGRNLNSVGGAAGFPYYMGFQSNSAYASASTDFFILQQPIEADMISDFAWGTAGAQPVTLSFWAYSSLTGTFGGFVQNYAATRSYPFTFAIPVANTWTKIILTIPGDTAGTWVMSGNAGSIIVGFDLGCGSSRRGPAGAWASANYTGVTGAVSVVGTSAATFYVTGVKLEIGSVATPFNRKSLAKSMVDCQRYYQQLGGSIAADLALQGYASAAAGIISCAVGYPTMRAAPTATRVGAWTLTNVSSVGLGAGVNTMSFIANATAAGQTRAYNTDTTGFVTLNAEL